MENLEALNEALVDVRERYRHQLRLQELLIGIERILSSERASLAELEAALKNEEKRFQKIKSQGLAGFMLKLFNNPEMQYEKILSMKLQYDAAVAATQSLEREKVELLIQIEDLGDPDEEIEAILEQKEAAMLAADDDNTHQLFALSEELANLRADMTELQEAIDAGNDAHQALIQLQSELQSVFWWSAGTDRDEITPAAARQLEDVQTTIHEVHHLLRRFRREVRDVDPNDRHGPALTGVVVMFDSFVKKVFNGLIETWLFQSTMESVHDKAEEITAVVVKMVKTLQARLNDAKQRVGVIDHQRTEFIENA